MFCLVSQKVRVAMNKVMMQLQGATEWKKNDLLQI
jgi:hypothetical protein